MTESDDVCVHIFVEQLDEQIGHRRASRFLFPGTSSPYPRTWGIDAVLARRAGGLSGAVATRATLRAACVAGGSGCTARATCSTASAACLTMVTVASALLRQQCASSPWRTWRTRTEYPQDGLLQICALVRPWAGDSRDTERYSVPPHDPA